ncbi:type II/IV secretion system ATPase subunit [Stygiolobus caldivivus]|uniref:Type II secretion protein VirB n=1 Tax=Stygiolobus caldivivus TaxID=2824673 RepID=A0A8D5ZJ81_9CREN|nr:type II/IV secretion system ATPase subunit [Stygiolobus caldivivus]BCU71294.1 type II secretion protein VirB [Stygiolobus caldivivus]
MSTELLEEYYVGPVKVNVLKKFNQCYYNVEEPRLSMLEEKAKEKVLSELYYTKVENLEEEVVKRLQSSKLSDESIEKILYYIKKTLLYGEITTLMLDPKVEEIEYKGYTYPITIIHRDYSECVRLYTNIVIQSDEDAIKTIEKLASKSNKSINIAKPYLEFSLPEGHRVAATISREISLPGSTFDIRKFPLKPFSIVEIMRYKMVNSLIASYLWLLLEYKPFLIILGATGSGKTTLLNALLNLINPNFKILTIEDTPEINIRSQNWVRFISRSTLSGNFDITMMDLARLSLRYRPDYLVVGEVRGKEIEALVHASASGHGSLTTFHGSRPTDAVTRITDLLASDLAKLFLQTIWAFIVVGNVKENNKTRRSVLSIYEVSSKSSKITFKKVVAWSYDKSEFSPSTVEDLIKKSILLKKLKEAYNVNVKMELDRRVKFLEGLEKSGVSSFEEVSQKILEFYGLGDNLEMASM